MKKKHGENGFTLIEAVVTVAIVAIAASLVFPMVQHFSHAELRKTTGMLASMIRQGYDNACLTGQIHRILFDFEKRKIILQSTTGSATINHEGEILIRKKSESSTNTLALPAGFNVALPQDAQTEESSSSATSKEKTENSVEEAHFQIIQSITLDQDIKLIDVWSDGLSEVATQGTPYLYFFPGGYTQDALIHFEDSDARPMTVQVWALMGKTAITDRYVEVPK